MIMKLFLKDFLWEEEVLKSGDLVFAQTGGGGVGIPKDSEKKPVYHWDR